MINKEIKNIGIKDGQQAIISNGVGIHPLIGVACQYIAWNLSVIPVDKDNSPIGVWKEAQKTYFNPKSQYGFNQPQFYGIGIVAGEVSGNLEIIDVDCKYDLTGTLFDDYKKLVFDVDPNLLKKLVVEKTRNKGYHLIYKCEKVEGNKKLANRPSTDEEKKIKKEKEKVLIETRGAGGFFAVAPSPGYEIIYGSLDKIQTITIEERAVLFNCARTFNQIVESIIEPTKKQKTKTDYTGFKSPFEDFNDRGDILEYLLQEGWTETGKHGKSIMLLRPGGEKKWSADYHTEMKLFYVFTQSTEFEEGKAYNHSQVLAIMKFNKDYSATSKFLLDKGFGERRNGNNYEVPKIKIASDCLFLADKKEMDDYLKSLRDGTFKMGMKTNIPELDEYFRFKEANLIVVNGMDNTGKSSIIWYIGVLSAIFYEWKWAILSAENKIGGIKRKLIEFYLCQHIKEMSEGDFKKASQWVDEHFFIISNN